MPNHPDKPLPAVCDCPAMVLLVDDQPLIGEAVRRALANEQGIDFHFCSDATDMLRVAGQIRPTVILQDLVMPGVDGLDLVRQVRATPTLTDIPIIVLSTREEAATKSAAFAAGANDYLVKLPDVVELVARIRYHSRSYVALQQRDEAYRALRESQQRLVDTNIELQKLMNADGLTGLANRRHLNDHLLMMWRRAQREATELSVLMIDVDQFKPYNDRYGHLSGDDALRRVADALRETVQRASDFVARYGGEEFMVVLPDTNTDGALQLAEQVRQRVESLAIGCDAPQPGAPLTVSIGVATQRPRLDDMVNDLVARADRALYQAKHNGRNQVVLHHHSLPPV